MPIPISKAAEAVSEQFEHLRGVAADVQKSIRGAKRDALDARDDVVRSITREPVKAAAIAFAAGAALGAFLGAFASWQCTRAVRSHD